MISIPNAPITINGDSSDWNEIPTVFFNDNHPSYSYDGYDFEEVKLTWQGDSFYVYTRLDALPTSHQERIFYVLEFTSTIEDRGNVNLRVQRDTAGTDPVFSVGFLHYTDKNSDPLYTNSFQWLDGNAYEAEYSISEMYEKLIFLDDLQMSFYITDYESGNNFEDTNTIGIESDFY